MKKLRKNFCVFIMSFGRADNVVTLQTLRKKKYTGAWYIVVSTDDPTLHEYKARFGKKVLVFSKEEIEKTFDVADNLPGKKTIVYARNACFEFAKELGYEYFLELDDDYTSFEWRFIKDGGQKLGVQSLYDLDSAFEIMLEFLDASGAQTVAFCQGGDFIGGVNGGGFRRKLLRKAMNTFFCTTERPFKFVGKFNEDVNAYVGDAIKGGLFFSVSDIAIVQKQTQANKGGMTDAYLASGTYVKSFYSVIFAPSAVYLAEMGHNHRRIHHRVRWNNCAPKIISEKWKK